MIIINENSVKTLRRYIQDKQMHYKLFRKLELDDFYKENYHSTDFERGFLAGSCHAFNLVTKDLQYDSEEADELVNGKYIGTGLKWVRRK